MRTQMYLQEETEAQLQFLTQMAMKWSAEVMEIALYM